MEKTESTIKISPKYQKTETVDLDRCRRLSLKWCLTLLVLVMVVVNSVISIWCLKTEVDELKKKLLVLEMKVEVEGQVLKNIQNLINSELKSDEKEQSDELFQSDFEEQNWHNEFIDKIDTKVFFPKEKINNFAKDVTNNGINHDDDDNENEENHGKNRRKREILDYNKNIQSEKHTKSSVKKNTEEKSSGERSLSSGASTEISSFEFSSDEKSILQSSKKSHLQRKHRKSRIGSAERFFTETDSTTSTPIQVRQSRTKPTALHGVDKTLWLQSQKFQQHTSAHKDTITKEEALRKGYGQHPEKMSYDLESSGKRSPDVLSYNMIMIHFSADTSHYSRERDPHYFGNGRMQIKSEVYKDWKAAHWTQGVGMSKYFHLHQGRVTLSTTGIYLIYAQIQYSNVQEVNGFSVFRNNEVVVQCITTSAHPDKLEIKSNTCGISTTILLQSNDSVCIKDLHHGRYVVLTPEKSYFGLVLLSPFKN